MIKTQQPKVKPKNETLLFGHNFSDHMLEIDFQDGKWSPPVLKPYSPLVLDPSCSVFHYGLECFEGMKAYKDSSNQCRLFRPEMNMSRFLKSAQRLSLPSFDPEELLKCIKELVKLDSDWIPKEKGYSLYIRPTLISTEPTLGVASPTKVFGSNQRRKYSLFVHQLVHTIKQDSMQST